MVWPPVGETPPPPVSPRATRRRKILIWVGALTTTVGLGWTALFVVPVITHVGASMSRTLAAPVYPTPVDTSMPLRRSEYAVFELTGHTSGGPGVTFTERRAPTLQPADVEVTDGNGVALATRGPRNGTETLTRGSDIYTVAVYFDAPEAGPYHVVVHSAPSGRVVISPSLTSGFRGTGANTRSLAVGSLVTFVGVVLLLGTAARRRKRPAKVAVASTSTENRLAPPGWYPDPHAPHQWRWWDGRTWSAPTNPQASPGDPPNH